MQHTNLLFEWQVQTHAVPGSRSPRLPLVAHCTDVTRGVELGRHLCSRPAEACNPTIIGPVSVSRVEDASPVIATTRDGHCIRVDYLVTDHERFAREAIARWFRPCPLPNLCLATTRQLRRTCCRFIACFRGQTSHSKVGQFH
jgi:hypothetical protein